MSYSNNRFRLTEKILFLDKFRSAGQSAFFNKVRINRTLSQQQVLVLEGMVVKVVVSRLLLFLAVELLFLNTYSDLMPVGFLMVGCVIICFSMKIDAPLHRLEVKIIGPDT